MNAGIFLQQRYHCLHIYFTQHAIVRHPSTTLLNRGQNEGYKFYLFDDVFMDDVIMKKLNIAYAAVALAMALGQQAMAGDGDGTITFNGKVTDVTCTVAATGPDGTSTVKLPTVSATALSGDTATAGATPFTISLSECGGDLANATNVAVYFEPGGNVNVNGRLNNTAPTLTAAKNVDIALYLAESVSTALSLGKIPTATYATIAPNGSTAKMDFVAKYYATAQATAGDVISNVTYSIIYP